MIDSRLGYDEADIFRHHDLRPALQLFPEIDETGLDKLKSMILTGPDLSFIWFQVSAFDDSLGRMELFLQVFHQILFSGFRFDQEFKWHFPFLVDKLFKSCSFVSRSSQL